LIIYFRRFDANERICIRDDAAHARESSPLDPLGLNRINVANLNTSPNTVEILS